MAGRSIAMQLLDAFLARLEPRYEALRAGHFDAGAWSTRQVTTGHDVEVVTGDRRLRGRATGVDPESGSLVVEVERPRVVDRVRRGDALSGPRVTGSGCNG